MNITAIHNSQMIEYRSPFGAVECGTVVTLKLYINGDVDNVDLRLWYNDSEHIYPMQNHNGIFSIETIMPQTPMLVWYMFLIKKDNEYLYYGKDEYLNPEGNIFKQQPDSFQITIYEKNFKIPNWFSEGIMYKIFVDRFFNGNNDGYIYKKRNEYYIHNNWDEYVPYDNISKNNEFARNDFYGGNLNGIIKKLDYLNELGISILYLNPIFEAFSNHKYDTGDYMKIDDMFGNEGIFKDLCEKAKEKGIYIILDGVFSHTGINSRYFNKWGEYNSVGACQSKNSPYYEWYRFESFPDKYDCWWGIITLPNINEMTQSYREFVLNGNDSVIKHWLRCGAKGWRLDVADELPDEFIKEMRNAVKSTDEQAIIIGEVWEDASNKISYNIQREYLLGNELDSVMNYPFRDAIIGYIMGWHSAEYFNKIVMKIYENYPKPCFYSLMNLIDSHDVIRVKTLFGSAPDLPMDNRAEYKLSKDQEILANKRVRLASLWQMTFPGVPCIYYGDEIGMQGYSDPFNRAPFSWSNIDENMLIWYRKIIKIRNSFAILKTGYYKTVKAEEDILFYKREITNKLDVVGRECENGTAFILLNRNEQISHKVVIHTCYKKLYDPINEEEIETFEGDAEIMIPPISGLLYVGKGLVDS